MDESKFDGGPAFPVLNYEYKAIGDLHPSPTMQPGMSLRDWFAGQALSSLRGEGDWQDCEGGARFCYAYADAMLEEMDKKT